MLFSNQHFTLIFCNLKYIFKIKLEIGKSILPYINEKNKQTGVSFRVLKLAKYITCPSNVLQVKNESRQHYTTCLVLILIRKKFQCSVGLHSKAGSQSKIFHYQRRIRNPV